MSLLRKHVRRSRSGADVVDRRFLLTSCDSAATLVLNCVENEGGYILCDPCDSECSVTTYSVTNRAVPSWLACEVHWHTHDEIRRESAQLVIYPTYRLLGMLGEEPLDTTSEEDRDFELISRDGEHRITLAGNPSDIGYHCCFCKRPYSMSVWNLPADDLRHWLIPEVFWCEFGHGYLVTDLHKADELTPLDRREPSHMNALMCVAPGPAGPEKCEQDMLPPD